MIGGVLCERQVKDVLPILRKNKDQVILMLKKNYSIKFTFILKIDYKKKELFKEKVNFFKIRYAFFSKNVK